MANFNLTGSQRILAWLDTLQLPVATLCPLPAIMEDPWDWDVDRVIQELCTADRLWEPRVKTQSTPDPESFGNKLRESEVCHDWGTFSKS